MAYIKYRGAKHVPVTVEKKMTSGKHKGMLKVKTKEKVGDRPKGSVDYRKPDKVYGR